MKRCACRLLLGLAMIAPVHATEPNWCGRSRPHAVDVAQARAMQASGGVTVDLRDAQAAAWTGWDAELNRLYRALLQRIGGGERAVAVRAAQRAWLAWDAAEAASDSAMHADAGSSGPLAVAALSLERRRTRACTLRRLLDDPALVAD